jgi:cell division septum initiation protein DivIVA
MARPNILDRFRPVGAPGPAGPAGVPAADDQGPAAELAPVFAALATDLESCRELVEEARREADDVLSRAHAQAAAIVAKARLDAGAERARAAAGVEQAATVQDALLLAQAGKEADDLEEAGTARLPGTVQKVIATLLSERLTSQQPSSEQLTQLP